VVLQVGQTNETVEVNATASLLQAETATLGTVIENKVVTELPLNGRQYLSLAALTPNANVLSPVPGRRDPARVAIAPSREYPPVGSASFTITTLSTASKTWT
jgi:hypothetical protein